MEIQLICVIIGANKLNVVVPIEIQKVTIWGVKMCSAERNTNSTILLPHWSTQFTHIRLALANAEGLRKWWRIQLILFLLIFY